jgi:hypothetical protein
MKKVYGIHGKVQLRPYLKQAENQIYQKNVCAYVQRFRR